MSFVKLNGHISQEMWRYMIFGSLAVAIDVLILLFLKEVLGVYYLTAVTLAFLSGLLVSYYFSVRFVFRGYLRLKLVWETVIFFSIGAMGIWYNYQIIKFLTQDMGLNYLLAKSVAIIVVVSWNFFGKKLLLFNKIKNR